MKIFLVGAELLHANGQTDGQTDVTKLVVAVCNLAKAYCNASKKNKKPLNKKLFL